MFRRAPGPGGPDTRTSFRVTQEHRLGFRVWGVGAPFSVLSCLVRQYGLLGRQEYTSIWPARAAGDWERGQGAGTGRGGGAGRGHFEWNDLSGWGEMETETNSGGEGPL